MSEKKKWMAQWLNSWLENYLKSLQRVSLSFCLQYLGSLVTMLEQITRPVSSVAFCFSEQLTGSHALHVMPVNCSSRWEALLLTSYSFNSLQALRVPCCISSPKILDYRFNIPPKSKWPVAQRLIQQRRKWHSTHNMTAFSGVLAWKLWLFSINCGQYSSILQMAAPVMDQSL